MADTIIDGTGKGYQAGVTSDQRLLTEAVTETEAERANEKGNSYNMNTGIVNLSGTTETPMIYMKNNENEDVVIEGIVIGIWGSANGDGLDMISTTYRNPTAGTIVSGATDVPINSNRNYGSTNTLDADVYLGGDSITMTGGTEHLLVRITEESRSFVSINEVLPKGTSIGVSITPPTGNDSMNCYVALVCYKHN